MIERLNLLRFPLVAGVVLIHSYHPIYETMGVIGLFTKGFFSYGIASTAVPLFFLISGYLFFYKVEWSSKLYFHKIYSRIYTLLIPYLAWNLIALAYMVAFFGVPSANTSQFWFLQELMLLVLIAPVLHQMHRKGIVWLMLMVSLWLFLDWHTTWPVMSSVLPLTFFYAGSVAAVKGKSLFMMDRFGIASVVISVAIFTLTTILKDDYFGVLVNKVGIITGVIGALYLSQFLNRRIFLWLGSASFFVYAFHQPILGQVINRVFYWLNPVTDGQIITLYFGMAIVTCVVGVGLYWTMKRLVPGFTGFITGGRC